MVKIIRQEDIEPGVISASYVGTCYACGCAVKTEGDEMLDGVVARSNSDMKEGNLGIQVKCPNCQNWVSVRWLVVEEVSSLD